MCIGLGVVTAALFALMVALPAFAQNRTGVCTTQVTLNTSTASQVFPFQDVSGGRHYFLIQCNGANTCSCAMATGASASGPPGVTATNGILMNGSGGTTPAGSWTMVAAPGISIPVGETDCISVGGASSVVACDW